MPDELPKTASVPLVGFLTVEDVDDGDSFIAAWMVTDGRGYPLEFRATTPVRPSLVQKTLYGAKLEHYIGVELCGRQLIQQSQRKPGLVLVPETWLLELADAVEVDMAAIWRAGETLKTDEEEAEHGIRGTVSGANSSLVYRMKLADSSQEGDRLKQLELCASSFDLAEAFARMRTALQLLAKEDPRYA